MRLMTILVLLLLLSGCAHYVTPGGGVSLVAIDDAGIEEAYAREPASAYPASLAIVRVQDAGYLSRTSRGHNLGRYSVVTTRDIETDEAFELINRLPLIDGVAPLSRLLLPPSASNIRDLRMPAAQLQADMILVYSVETTFTIDGRPLGPLSAISLGMLPSRTAHVTATVSGILVDVRTGFVYGSSEATVVERQATNLWSTSLATDAARLRAERQAFENFVTDFTSLWTGVVNKHAASVATPAEALLPAGQQGWYQLQPDD